MSKLSLLILLSVGIFTACSVDADRGEERASTHNALRQKKPGNPNKECSKPEDPTNACTRKKTEATCLVEPGCAWGKVNSGTVCFYVGDVVAQSPDFESPPTDCGFEPPPPCDPDQPGDAEDPDQPKEPPYDCPEDAKVCPDGSSVGRIGPNCEFAPCPGSSGPKCGSIQCAAGEVCCNALSEICAKPGEFCAF